jgi:hypothetical protein
MFSNGEQRGASYPVTNRRAAFFITCLIQPLHGHTAILIGAQAVPVLAGYGAGFKQKLS